MVVIETQEADFGQINMYLSTSTIGSWWSQWVDTAAHCLYLWWRWKCDTLWVTFGRLLWPHSLSCSISKCWFWRFLCNLIAICFLDCAGVSSMFPLTFSFWSKETVKSKDWTFSLFFMRLMPLLSQLDLVFRVCTQPSANLHCRDYVFFQDVQSPH